MTEDDSSAKDSGIELPALDERDVSRDPFEQFRCWFDAALASDLPEPTAMALATASSAGCPSARIVLLKSYDRRGFVFHTNYESRKGRDVAENPKGALVLFWQPLHRQIRIEGAVERISAAESDAYFASRTRSARLGAIVSAQSGVAGDRGEIEAHFDKLQRESKGKDVVRPGNWGGMRVVPSIFEFWQGRDDRLHDRFRYTLLSDETWRIERLWP